MRHPHSCIAAILDGRLYGPAVDTITSTGTAIGSTLAATTIATGDSFQIKNTNNNTPAWLLAAWAKNQAAGQLRIRSPKFHDNVDALRARIVSGQLDPYIPAGLPQRLFAQDIETVELAGSAVGGQIEDVVQMIYYEDLPGQSARLIDEQTLLTRAALAGGAQNIVGVRLAITLPTTAGYGGGKALNADVDLLQANTDYAVLGIQVDLLAAAICLRGPDTGNLRYPFPSDIKLGRVVGNWSLRLARIFRKPLIPVINSANKGATFIDAVSDQAGGTCNVTLFLAQLKP